MELLLLRTLELNGELQWNQPKKILAFHEVTKQEKYKRRNETRFGTCLWL